MGSTGDDAENPTGELKPPDRTRLPLFLREMDTVARQLSQPESITHQLEPDHHHAIRKFHLVSDQHPDQIGSVTIRLHDDYLDRYADQPEVVSQAWQMRADRLTTVLTEKTQQGAGFDGELVKPLGSHRDRRWASEVACQLNHHQHKASADQ